MKTKYNYHWTQVNIRPETKQALMILCGALGNNIMNVPQSTVIDTLVNDKIKELNLKKIIL